MSPDYVVTLLRDKRGPRAVQTVRQYNTIMGFRPETLNFDNKAKATLFYYYYYVFKHYLSIP